MSAPIVVVGQPRGGTSAIAGVLRLSGVDLGKIDGIKIDVHEDEEMMRLREENRLSEGIAKRVHLPLWGWKDPFLIESLASRDHAHMPEGTRYILVRRPVEEVIDSTIRHTKLDTLDRVQIRFVLSKARYRAELLDQWKARATHIVQFNDLRNNPKEEVTKILDSLDLTADLNTCVDFLSGSYRTL